MTNTVGSESWFCYEIKVKTKSAWAVYVSNSVHLNFDKIVASEKGKKLQLKNS